MTSRAVQEVWPDTEEPRPPIPSSFRSIDERSLGIEVVLPTRVSEVAPAPGSEEAGRGWRRFSLWAAAFLLLGAISIAGLTFWSYRVTTQHAANAVARADVLEAALAMRRMPEDAHFQLMIRGPAFLPDSRGTRVSEGTTLFLERLGSGDIYVRGTHAKGTMTYYVHNGDLFAAPGVD